jgi:hypothetical protein
MEHYARMFASQFALKTTGRSAAVAGDVRRIVREELKNVPVARVTTMDDLVDASVVPERVIATLSNFFGGLGASLAALGLYGLLAYTVTRRTNEIGIRIALGAAESDISRMVLRGAFGLVCAGLVIGVPLALLSRRAASRCRYRPARGERLAARVRHRHDARDRSRSGVRAGTSRGQSGPGRGVAAMTGRYIAIRRQW